jgi:hypothetical protein
MSKLPEDLGPLDPSIFLLDFSPNILGFEAGVNQEQLASAWETV